MNSKAIKDLILWLRKERISYSSITIGGLTLDGVIDGKAPTAKVEKVEPRQSAWDRNVQQILNQPASPVDDVPDEAKID